jgi:hypothetical protein
MSHLISNEVSKISDNPGHKINNDKGYVLLWTVIISMVLVIAVAAVLTMSLSYNLRSTNNNSERQAYFTARSVVNALAYEIQGPQPTENGKSILDLMYSSNGSCTINDFQFEGIDGYMGSCTATIKREQFGHSDTILITATATVGNSAKSVSARLIFRDGGELSSFAIFNIASARGLIYGLQTGAGTGLYLESAEGNVKLDTKSQNQQNVILRGDIYVGTPLWLQASHYAAPHAHGDIISNKNIYIFDTFTVGPYAGCCEREDPDTEIHTTGTVNIEDNASIYSTITAQTVNAGDFCHLYNDISGNVVDISGNAVVNGNITANTLYLAGNVQINGDVTAAILTMDGSAKITGQVNAYNISINRGATIDGDVTVHFITATNVLNTLLIQGALTAESAIGPDVTASSYRLGIPYTGSLTPVAAIVSKLPVLPEEPDLPVQPAGAEPYNDDEAILGYTDGRDSYYVVDSKLTVSTLKTQGSGNIYLYVPRGSRLTLHQMQTLNMTNPNLYIIVANGGTLLFANENKDFYGYIYGESGSKVDLGDRTHIYGGVRAEDVFYGLDTYIQFPANTSDPQGGNGSSGQWMLSGYENP